MATVRGALTHGDLHELIKGSTDEDRALAAHKLCRRIDRDDLSDEERRRAQEILRIMAADAAELVRRALAVTLKNSPLLPRDVARRLARDVESVCIPVLNFSPVFDDADLAEIVRKGGAVRQTAVAKRPALSPAVTDALAETGCEEAVRIACANDNAQFSDAGLGRVVDRFAETNAVLDTVAHRRILPLAVTEKLVTLVGEAVREHLINHHALTPETALRIAGDAGERATLDLVDQAGRTNDVKAFVAHLKANERLTGSLILRALAQGHMTFFEWAVAELAGVPHPRTWIMIHDAGPLGLRAIYERAGLPARMFQAFRAGVDTHHSMEFDGGPRDRERFQERMVQRFLTQSPGAPKEDVDYLLEKMDHIGAAAAQDRRPVVELFEPELRQAG